MSPELVEGPSTGSGRILLSLGWPTALSLRHGSPLEQKCSCAPAVSTGHASTTCRHPPPQARRGSDGCSSPAVARTAQSGSQTSPVVDARTCCRGFVCRHGCPRVAQRGALPACAPRPTGQLGHTPVHFRRNRGMAKAARQLIRTIDDPGSGSSPSSLSCSGRASRSSIRWGSFATCWSQRSGCTSSSPTPQVDSLGGPSE